MSEANFLDSIWLCTFCELGLLTEKRKKWGHLMRYNSNTPVNVRITRRNRKKKPGFIIFLLLIALTVGTLYFFDKMGAGAIVALFQDGTGQVAGNNGTSTGASTDSGDNSTNTVDTGTNTSTNIGTNSGTNTNTGTGNSTDKTGDNTNSSTNTGTGSKQKDINLLKNEIEIYIKDFEGQYGVYFMSLEDEIEFGINESDEYIAASTFKIPLSLYLFKKIEDGTVDPESIMTYQKSDYEDGTGQIQYEKVGTKYKIRTLSRLSIEVSDNVATNMLLRLLGSKNVKDFMRTMGGTVVDNGRNISCPVDMALYMKKVYEFHNSNNELGEELIGYFENTDFNDRIPKLLPPELIIAHKIGNQVAAIHDVGIVFTEKPYIISVMSKNIIEKEAYDIIANISKKVYDFQEEEK